MKKGFSNRIGQMTLRDWKAELYKFADIKDCDQNEKR